MTRALLGTAPAGATNAVRWQDLLAQNTATMPTNGWYLPSANTLGVATNGVQRGTISSAGLWSIAANLTVGTSIQATGFTTAGWTGPGAEIGYSSGIAIFQGYNRTSSAYLPVYLTGSTISLTGGAVSISNTLGVTGATTLTGQLNVAAPIVRSQTTGGYLSGNFNAVEAVGTTAGMIYCIGPGYTGAGSGSTPLYSGNGMYGVGFTYSTTPNGSSGSTTIAGTVGAPSAWGLYVASQGVACIFLDSDNGGGYFSGPLSAKAISGTNLALSGTGSLLQVGSTKYSWGSSTNVIEMGVGGGVYAYTDGQITLSANLYYDGSTFRYKVAGAGNYFSLGGANGTGYYWGIFPSGSAGAAASPSLIMSLSNAGNLYIPGALMQLGVSPSAWGSFSAFDIGTGSIGSYSVGTDIQIDCNGYYDGSNWRYKTAAPLCFFELNNGSFNWSTAPSGSAGAAATMTQRMTLSNTGALTVNGAAVSSDLHLKENVAPIPHALDLIKSFNGVRFDWIETGEKSAGLIAQDVERLMPELVSPGLNDRKALNYNGVIAVLVEAVKEQQAQIDALKGLKL